MNRRRFLALAACAPFARHFAPFCAIRAPLLRLAPPARRLVAFGDSITVGDGAHDHAFGYAQLLASRLGFLLDNCAVSGTRMIDHRAAIEACTFRSSDVVIWLTGYNDMRIGTSLEEYQTDLRAALALIPGAYVGNCLRMPPDSYAIPPNDKGSDARVAEFNRVIAEEASAAGCVPINACGAWDTRLCDDTIHPNDAGHAQIARAFLRAMPRPVYLPIAP